MLNLVAGLSTNHHGESCSEQKRPCHAGKKRREGTQRFGSARAPRESISGAKLSRGEGNAHRDWSLPRIGALPSEGRGKVRDPIPEGLCDFASAYGGLVDRLSAMGEGSIDTVVIVESLSNPVSKGEFDGRLRYSHQRRNNCRWNTRPSLPRRRLDPERPNRPSWWTSAWLRQQDDRC